jgi:hypothetical protein
MKLNSKPENKMSETKKLGKKYDEFKTDWSLLPMSTISPVISVLMFGAEKYGRDNWRKVADGPRRYYSAAQRHLAAYQSGETHDEETGEPHLAHAMCCLIFLLALEHPEK